MSVLNGGGGGGGADFTSGECSKRNAFAASLFAINLSTTTFNSQFSTLNYVQQTNLPFWIINIQFFSAVREKKVKKWQKRRKFGEFGVN